MAHSTDLKVGSYQRITRMAENARDKFKQGQTDRVRCQCGHNTVSDHGKATLSKCRTSFRLLDETNPKCHLLRWYTGFGLLLGGLFYFLFSHRTQALVNMWLLERAINQASSTV